jgi:hypothetical protein
MAGEIIPSGAEIKLRVWNRDRKPFNYSLDNMHKAIEAFCQALRPDCKEADPEAGIVVDEVTYEPVRCWAGVTSSGCIFVPMKEYTNGGFSFNTRPVFYLDENIRQYAFLVQYPSDEKPQFATLAEVLKMVGFEVRDRSRFD